MADLGTVFVADEPAAPLTVVSYAVPITGTAYGGGVSIAPPPPAASTQLLATGYGLAGTFQPPPCPDCPELPNGVLWPPSGRRF